MTLSTNEILMTIRSSTFLKMAQKKMTCKNEIQKESFLVYSFDLLKQGLQRESRMQIHL